MSSDGESHETQAVAREFHNRDWLLLQTQAVVRCLKNQFSPDGNELEWQFRLQQRTQKPEESLIEFSGALGQLADKAYPNWSGEQRQEMPFNKKQLKQRKRDYTEKEAPTSPWLYVLDISKERMNLLSPPPGASTHQTLNICLSRQLRESDAAVRQLTAQLEQLKGRRVEQDNRHGPRDQFANQEDRMRRQVQSLL
eukprot:Em0001g2382a